MNPIENHFGPEDDKIAIRYNDGEQVVDGHIIRQVGTRRYLVSDGDRQRTVTLVRQKTDTDLMLEDQATILVNTPTGVEHAHRLETEYCTTIEGYRYNWMQANSKYDSVEIARIESINIEVA